ncbi:Site-specific DNA recombinase [Pseudonocardia ammonioxydans]|uniref:Site-specific DNA recombinase n=1 Tax=Pseudonocardia ammonioxydans TaxID=260086 RepID=A0A1I5GFU3_PSUAM|nr:recombinase family protein [Pseudonocardia ammonioxydans]SFO34773.1 Site-specific DNA recombinase [Pseudonocardia ammonioxydans]
MNPPSSPRRAVAYARVSRLATGDERGQHDAKSVGQQLDELHRLAERDGVDVLATFRDDGISASRYARGKVRDGWQATMDMIMSGDVDELWVWEISRATRDRPVWAALVGACTAQGVKITVNGRVHDPGDPDDGFMLDLAAALAVRESGTTSKRIRRDVAARARKGLPHGRIPYGYRRVYDQHTKALIRQEVDPDTAKIVRYLAGQVRRGVAFYRLARKMNDDCVPSPETHRMHRSGVQGPGQPWRVDQVEDVVASPAMAGLRVHQGKVLDEVTAAWPAIIPLATHRAIVRMLADPARRSQTDASAKYLLTGLATCGECGGKIRRIKNRGTPSYACAGNRAQHMAGARRFCVSRKIEFVDAYVTDVIVERLSQPDMLDMFAPEDSADARAAARRDLEEARADLEALRAAAKARTVSIVSFLDLEPGLVARVADAERRVQPVEVPALLDEVAGPDAAARWEALEPEQKREIIRMLADIRIMRRPGTYRGRTDFDPSLVRIKWRRPGRQAAA